MEWNSRPPVQNDNLVCLPTSISNRTQRYPNSAPSTMPLRSFVLRAYCRDFSPPPKFMKKLSTRCCYSTFLVIWKVASWCQRSTFLTTVVGFSESLTIWPRDKELSSTFSKAYYCRMSTFAKMDISIAKPTTNFLITSLQRSPLMLGRKYLHKDAKLDATALMWLKLPKLLVIFGIKLHRIQYKFLKLS